MSHERTSGTSEAVVTTAEPAAHTSGSWRLAASSLSVGMGDWRESAHAQPADQSVMTRFSAVRLQAVNAARRGLQ